MSQILSYRVRRFAALHMLLTGRPSLPKKKLRRPAEPRQAHLGLTDKATMAAQRSGFSALEIEPVSNQFGDT